MTPQRRPPPRPYPGITVDVDLTWPGYSGLSIHRRGDDGLFISAVTRWLPWCDEVRLGFDRLGARLRVYDGVTLGDVATRRRRCILDLAGLDLNRDREAALEAGVLETIRAAYLTQMGIPLEHAKTSEGEEARETSGTTRTSDAERNSDLRAAPGSVNA